MNLFQSFLLGIVQGLTEFIPVSSTAHLLIGQHLMGIPADDTGLFIFNVLVQLGTLLALIVYFWNNLWAILKGFFAKPFSTPLNRLAWYIIIATIPALIFGYLIKPTVEDLFQNQLLAAAIRLLITAVILSLAEWLGKRNRTLEKMTWLDALFVGIAQVLAVFPGASRSGTTISGGMARGLDRPSAARFAFLMSVPVMLAAGGYEMLGLFKLPHLGSSISLIAVGFIAAAIVGWFAVKWLLGYLNKHSLYVFAIYCAVVGTACLVFALI